MPKHNRFGLVLFSRSHHFLMSYLCICVYNIIFRQQLSDIISDIMREEFQYGKYVLLGIGIIFILPLCLLRDISKLSFVSFLSAISVLIIVILTITRSPFYHKQVTSVWHLLFYYFTAFFVYLCIKTYKKNKIKKS